MLGPKCGVVTRKQIGQRPSAHTSGGCAVSLPPRFAVRRCDRGGEARAHRPLRAVVLDIHTEQMLH